MTPKRVYPWQPWMAFYGVVQIGEGLVRLLTLGFYSVDWLTPYLAYKGRQMQAKLERFKKERANEN